MNRRTKYLLVTFYLIAFFSTACKDDLPTSSSFKPEDVQLETKLQTYLSQSYPCNITSVEVTKDNVIIKGNKPSELSTIYLGEIAPYENVVEANKFSPSYPVTENYFTITVDRYLKQGDTTYDRLLSKWILFTPEEKTDKIVSSAHYADIIYSNQELEQLKLRNKKGIGGLFYNQFVSDIDDLNISSATVNVVVNHFFHLSPMSGDIPYEYGGKTYYVNEPYLNSSLDKILILAATRKISVAAIILFNRAEDSIDPLFGKLMEHPDNNGGAYTMPNMTTPESVHAYAAVMNYLASRYCRKDNLYGRIAHWIIHNEVDASIQWVNMGVKPITVFTDTYLKSMRLCYNIVRQYDTHSETFASFTHSWTSPCSPEWNSSKDILTLLNKYSQTEGDFQWAVAYHSYPYDLFNPRTWDDPRATLSMNTEFITFRNLEVLNKWALTKENMYLKKIKRSVWLSEAGINSRSYSEESFKEQSAGFAYAWKKLNGLEGIDGLQWHNWFDNEGDGGGILLGLRKFIDKNNGEPKPVWELYRQAGTPTEDEAFAPSLDVIGISDWNIIDPF